MKNRNEVNYEDEYEFYIELKSLQNGDNLGVHDFKGIEIRFGDTLKWDDIVGVVEYSEEDDLMLVATQNSKEFLTKEYAKNFKIIHRSNK